MNIHHKIDVSLLMRSRPNRDYQDCQSCKYMLSVPGGSRVRQVCIVKLAAFKQMDSYDTRSCYSTVRTAAGQGRECHSHTPLHRPPFGKKAQSPGRQR